LKAKKIRIRKKRIIMKIGIIFYSLSRHTLSLARTLQQSLVESGHSVSLSQLETTQLKIAQQTAVLKSIPPVDGYDLLVLACPVHGGRAAAPMQAFLEQCPTLRGKKVACLVTQVFPHWLGGDQTLAAMQAFCESKGASVLTTGSVSWYSFTRRRQIEAIIAKLKSVK
jgi:NAD(P)H dehydrogenase (quinone)